MSEAQTQKGEEQKQSSSKKKYVSYFTEDLKRDLVEEFCVLYNNHDIGVILGKKVPDENAWYTNVDTRFTDFDKLVDMYSGVTLVSEADKEAIVPKLYSMIIQVKREGRITGKQVFSLKPHTEKKYAEFFEQLDTDVANLTERFDNVSELAQITWKQWSWFKKREGIKDEDIKE